MKDLSSKWRELGAEERNDDGVVNNGGDIRQMEQGEKSHLTEEEKRSD